MEIEISLDSICVYNPKVEGLDYNTYESRYRALLEKSSKEAYSFHDELFFKVINSEFSSTEEEITQTLERFLYSKEGYFESHPDIHALLFMEGKFHSQYTNREEAYSVVETYAKIANAIPFLFTYDPLCCDNLREHCLLEHVEGKPALF